MQMQPEKDIEIVVSAHEPAEERVLLSTIVTCIVQSTVRRFDREVLVSIRDRGEEIVQGAENISAVLRGTHNASSYSLLRALENPMEIPDTLSLTLECEGQFCGRVNFYCNGGNAPEQYDALISLVNEKTTPRESTLLPLSSAGVVVAVQRETEPDAGESLREYVKTNYPDVLLCEENVNFAFSWYNPYGYLGGVQRDADNPYPYGIDSLFWETMRTAAAAKIHAMQRHLKNSTDTIRRLRSKYQADSVRRMLELDIARHNYTTAVRSLYAAQQLKALTEGDPLAGTGDMTKE